MLDGNQCKGENNNAGVLWKKVLDIFDKEPSKALTDKVT